MDLSSLLSEADALFNAGQFSRALPLYQQHINEVYQTPDNTLLIAAARSYRMLAKCYRYTGQWEHALPALLDSLRCIEEWRECSLPCEGSVSDDDGCRALRLEQHVHHMLADTYSVLAEQQQRNISNPMRLSRALYHCLVSDRLATELLDASYKQGEEEIVAAVDASVAVQVSLGCVYRLMVRQAHQALQHKLLAKLPTTNAAEGERGKNEDVAEVELRWQRHDILNLCWLSVAELEVLIAEWFGEAKAILHGALRPLQSFRAHHLLTAICDELQKLYEARRDA